MDLSLYTSESQIEKKSTAANVAANAGRSAVKRRSTAEDTSSIGQPKIRRRKGNAAAMPVALKKIRAAEVGKGTKPGRKRKRKTAKGDEDDEDDDDEDDNNTDEDYSPVGKQRRSSARASTTSTTTTTVTDSATTKTAAKAAVAVITAHNIDASMAAVFAISKNAGRNNNNAVSNYNSRRSLYESICLSISLMARIETPTAVIAGICVQSGVQSL